MIPIHLVWALTILNRNFFAQNLRMCLQIRFKFPRHMQDVYEPKKTSRITRKNPAKSRKNPAKTIKIPQIQKWRILGVLISCKCCGFTINSGLGWHKADFWPYFGKEKYTHATNMSGFSMICNDVHTDPSSPVVFLVSGSFPDYIAS